MIKILALIIIIFITSCSSANRQGITATSDSSTPLKDIKIRTSFANEGVKITYLSNGLLESIEVTGQAPAWKKQVELLAEADAMAKLVNFIDGKDVSSDRRLKIISNAIDMASDVTSNKFQTVDGTLETNSSDLEADMRDNTNDFNQKNNTAIRKAQVVEKTLTTTVSSIRSKGFLVGVRKISEAVKDDGRIYVATFRWTQKDMDAVLNVRESMRKAQQR